MTIRAEGETVAVFQFASRQLPSDCVPNGGEYIDQIARCLNLAHQRYLRQELHFGWSDVVDALKFFVLLKLFPARALGANRFRNERLRMRVREKEQFAVVEAEHVGQLGNDLVGGMPLA